MLERLQKILSRAGISSRRAGEQLMLDGRVTVNGTTVRELGTKADASHDDIRVDGRRVKLAERPRYLLLNKPRGYVTTRSDPEHRPTVLDLLGGVREYVYPVGRLDFDSEGLLLLTNDGDLAARLTHPRHGIARVYQARVRGTPDAHDLDRLAKGVTFEGVRTHAAAVRLLSPPGRTAPRKDARGHQTRSPRAHTAFAGDPDSRLRAPRRETGVTALLEVTLTEGRNRQVRRMCEAIGHPVMLLTRVAIGPLRDPRLRLGHWRELSEREVEQLRLAASSQDRQRSTNHKRQKGSVHRPG